MLVASNGADLLRRDARHWRELILSLPKAGPRGARFTIMARARDGKLARRVVVLVSALALSAAACTGETADRSTEESRSPDLEGIAGRCTSGGHSQASDLDAQPGPALDPQTDYWNDSFEVFRCCLLRTLLAYPGLPTEGRRGELHPDLAAQMPEISGDGMTWTFRLKEGIAYGPPLQDTQVVAADIIRALEREAACFGTPTRSTTRSSRGSTRWCEEQWIRSRAWRRRTTQH